MICGVGVSTLLRRPCAAFVFESLAANSTFEAAAKRSTFEAEMKVVGVNGSAAAVWETLKYAKCDHGWTEPGTPKYRARPSPADRTLANDALGSGGSARG